MDPLLNAILKHAPYWAPPFLGGSFVLGFVHRTLQIAKLRREVDLLEYQLRERDKQRTRRARETRTDSETSGEDETDVLVLEINQDTSIRRALREALESESNQRHRRKILLVSLAVILVPLAAWPLSTARSSQTNLRQTIVGARPSPQPTPEVDRGPRRDPPAPDQAAAAIQHLRDAEAARLECDSLTASALSDPHQGDQVVLVGCGETLVFLSSRPLSDCDPTATTDPCEFLRREGEVVPDDPELTYDCPTREIVLPIEPGRSKSKTHLCGGRLLPAGTWSVDLGDVEPTGHVGAPEFEVQIEGCDVRSKAIVMKLSARDEVMNPPELVVETPCDGKLTLSIARRNADGDIDLRLTPEVVQL